MPVLYKCRCASPSPKVRGRQRRTITSCWSKADCLAAVAVWYKYPSNLDDKDARLFSERLVTKVSGYLVHSEECAEAELLRAPSLKLHQEIKVILMQA